MVGEVVRMVGSIQVVVARFVIFPRVSISTSSQLIATKRYYATT
jgi:hypothetical protein